MISKSFNFLSLLFCFILLLTFNVDMVIENILDIFRKCLSYEEKMDRDLVYHYCKVPRKNEKF